MNSPNYPAPLDDFYVCPSEYAEDLAHYRPGGFHPVHLGDLLSTIPGTTAPRYRVLHKLGFGGQATVWLAEDLSTENKRGVAVKILSSACSGKGKNNEIPIMRWLRDQQVDAEHPGSQNVIRLLDYFKLQGPNGEHDVLVLNLCFSMKDLELRWSLETRKRLGFQLAKGLAYLHAHGIVHGDLHRANLGIEIKALETIPAERVSLQFMMRLTPVIPRDPVKYPPSALPKYTVDCPFAINPQVAHHLIPMIEDGGIDSLNLQILDLGEAFRKDDPVPDPNMRALVALPPEILLGDFSRDAVDFAFGARADMWALGCTLFELLLCFRPFPCHSKDELWCMMLGLADGKAPERWKGRPVHIEAGAARCLMEENTWTRLREDILTDPLHHVPKEDVDPALVLIKQLLVLEPALRPEAEDVVRYAWLSEQGTSNVLDPMHATRIFKEKSTTW